MITQKIGDFERQIAFKPGFDWRTEDSNRNFGISAMRLWFILIGDQGAVQWQIGTDWFPESARRHLSNFSQEPKFKPDGWDLGYHSKVPMYDGQSTHACDTLSDGKCYYDGSGCNADLLIEGFLNGGDEWIWNRLEAYYHYTFNGKDWPSFDPIIMPHPDKRALA
jgi:hypothetical protein